MAVSLGVFSCLGYLSLAARVAKKQQKSQEWHSVVYDGVMEIDQDAPPAFISQHGKDLWISNFGVKKGSILPATSTITTIPVKDMASALSSGNMRSLHQTTVLDSGIKWPNEIEHAPASVSGSYGDILVIPDGFLVPGKRNGGVYFHNNGNLHCITPFKENAFYHEVEWRDMDGDGHLDILTPRAIFSGIFKASFQGEYMWYKNPGPSKMMSQEWEEHKIIDGPDVICKTVDYQGGLASFCSQFWTGTGQLVVHGLSKQGVHQWSRVIDDNCIKCFSVKPVDLDGDGTLDLMVTNHADKKNESAVFGYEVPWNNLQSGSFKKHVLATNIFQTILGNTGVGAPGFPEAFYPQVGTTRGPMHIVVPGDGSLDVWHLAPISGQRFAYNARQVRRPQGTTGKMLVSDIDGDGIMDVVVPDNDMFQIWAFTFAPGEAPATTPEPRDCPWYCHGPGACKNNNCKWNCDSCWS